MFHHWEVDKNQYDDTCEIFWASGACMLIRADLFHRVGGLDKLFFAHMEEIDLCWRVKNSGYKIMVVPKSVVYHVGGSIISYGSFSKIFHNYRNTLVMMLKNLSFGQLLILLPIRFVLDQIAALRAIFMGNMTELKAILAADINFIFRFGKWLKARKQARQLINQPNLQGWYKKSLVFEVFSIFDVLLLNLCFLLLMLMLLLLLLLLSLLLLLLLSLLLLLLFVFVCFLLKHFLLKMFFL